MNEPQAHARRSGPSTSAEAAASVRDITETQVLIAGLFATHGAMTRDQLTAAWRKEYPQRLATDQSIRSRLSELMDRGLIVVVSETTNHRGRKVQVVGLPLVGDGSLFSLDQEIPEGLVSGDRGKRTARHPGKETTMDPTLIHYFTVGIKYRDEPHPRLGDRANPNGWIEVRGTDAETARALVIAAVGKEWAFQYTHETFTRRYHPDGPFLTISVTPDLTEVVSAGQ